MDPYASSKILFQTKKLQQLKEDQPISPTMIQVDLEAWCNDNCRFCAYRKDNAYNSEMVNLLGESKGHEEFKPIGKPSPRSGLPKEMAWKIPAMMKDAGIPAIELTGGGEPTLWPYFDQLIDNLTEKGIEIGLVTNGSGLSLPRVLKLASYEKTIWIRLSMDAGTAPVHHVVHRTNPKQYNLIWKKRLQTLENLGKYKHKDLTLGVSYIINLDNYKDVDNACKLYRDMEGVDYIRFSWEYDSTGTASFTDKQITAIKQRIRHCKTAYVTNSFKVLGNVNRIDFYNYPNNDFNSCTYQHFVWNIGADCLVYPCCIQKYNPGWEIGDIRKNSLKELVDSRKRHEQMTKLNVLDCHPCWLRDRNKAAESALKEPAHSNFI